MNIKSETCLDIKYKILILKVADFCNRKSFTINIQFKIIFSNFHHLVQCHNTCIFFKKEIKYFNLVVIYLQPSLYVIPKMCRNPSYQPFSAITPFVSSSFIMCKNGINTNIMMASGQYRLVKPMLLRVGVSNVIAVPTSSSSHPTNEIFIETIRRELSYSWAFAFKIPFAKLASCCLKIELE